MAKADHYAIVIGIDRYPDPFLGDLHASVSDAEAFSQWLLDPEGGDLEEDNVSLLRSTDFPASTGRGDARPVPHDINSLFEPFVVKSSQGRIGERLYIFVAGHGFSASLDLYAIYRPAVYAANAKKLFGHHVNIPAYAEFFRRLRAFDEIVLFMDCCRYNSSTHTVTNPQLPALPASEYASKVKSFRAYATGAGGKTREKEFEPGKWSGIFTRTFLEALKMALPNENGAVTGQEVYDYIHYRIAAVADPVPIVNQPEINLNLGGNEIVFR